MKGMFRIAWAVSEVGMRLPESPPLLPRFELPLRDGIPVCGDGFSGIA